LRVAGEESFAGHIRRGLGGDTIGLDWRARRVLILGHGPFAIENARTALEQAAAHATFGVRRHGIVCPEIIDYVNYIREYDESLHHFQDGSARLVAVWREAYRESSATPPEVWNQGRFLPEGHTVSVSDVYFIASHVGLLDSVVGTAMLFDPFGVTLSSGAHVSASIVIKAVGFELNEGSERIVGRVQVYGGCLIDSSLWTIVEPHPDGNFSGGVFGSYMDSVVFQCQMLLRYWQETDLYQQQLNNLFHTGYRAAARINRITSSEGADGLQLLIRGDPGLVPLLREHANAVAASCHHVWSPAEFMVHSKAQWGKLHAQLRAHNGAVFEAEMPYMMEKAMEVVMHENSARELAAETPKDAALCIIGGGTIGIIIARDAASCGHKSIVLDKETVIGGVWMKNDYPGLRLQTTGAAYRCLSLAPAWARDGEGRADVLYRPTGKEVLSYLHDMAAHELIEVVQSWESNPRSACLLLAVSLR
jgi:hypothetical protein